MHQFDNPSQDFMDKISSYIESSGFPFEWDVRKQILEANKNVSVTHKEVLSNQTYIDPQEHSLRESDIFWYLDESFDRKTPVSERLGVSWNYFF